MEKKSKIIIALSVALAGVMVFILSHIRNAAILNPKGPISLDEKHLMLVVILIMLAVVIPTFISVVVIVKKYRADKPNATYTPNAVSSPFSAFVLWAIPAVVIFIIGILNWQSTHALDPYKPIASAHKPITIQVVALQWKWLFIYPDQNIATVNFIEFPANTPVNFQLTADAPMNSFWIPELGGQMYAMPGMSTQLHLMANQTGEFKGSDAEISGAGFEGMKFTAKATSQIDFDQWVRSIQQGSNVSDSQNNLDMNEYNNLAKPSENNPKVFYSSVNENLYSSVIMKFMAPQSEKVMSDMEMK